jgi:YidC/Oxa1 family membrane protein insertase
MKKTNKIESILLIVFISLFCSIALFAWWKWYQQPLMKYQQYQASQQANNQVNSNEVQAINNTANDVNQVNNSLNISQEYNSSLKINIDFTNSTEDRKQTIESQKENRFFFNTAFVKGSVNTIGLVFDDLTLIKYNQDTKDKKNVSILSPAKYYQRGLIYYTFFSDNQSIELPNLNTKWSLVKSDDKKATFAWQNSQGIKFVVELGIPDDLNPYKFKVNHSIINNSSLDFNIWIKGQMLKTLNDEQINPSNVATGFIGYADGSLQENGYKDLKKINAKSFSTATLKNKKNGLEQSWFGLNDKYWFSGFFNPSSISVVNFEKELNDQSAKTFSVNFSTKLINATKNEEVSINKGELFLGAKDIELLSSSHYKQYKLFDRVIDFGLLYVLTKPLLLLLNFINNFVSNYGVSIILMTIVIKMLLYPLSKKSFNSMAKIKKIAPVIDEIKKRNKDDRRKTQAEIASIYKTQGINPASGCLPMLLQIPVFIALYKVLFVSIELRHADFAFWIHDLSAKDPLSIFNLFGLIPLDMPSFLVIGPLPILMGVSMFVQQRMNDQTQQANAMFDMSFVKWLPLVFIFVFSSLPSGLLIYWIVSNVFSILQQLYFDKVVYHGVENSGIKLIKNIRVKKK